MEGSGETGEVRRGPMGRAGYRDLLFPASALRRLWWPVSEQRLNLPQTMPPTGDGYMPLYCAAQWIATEGGVVQFDPEDEAVWRAAYDQLLAAIASEKARVVGTRKGQREVIPGYHFAGRRVDYPFGSADLEMLLDEDLTLRSYPYIDEEHWFGGFDDALITRWEDRWTRLMVERGDVRRRWAYPVPETKVEVILQSGMPGRPPKSKHLVEDEFRRRAAAGELAESLAIEAQALLDWLRSTYPMHPVPTVRTIQNNIRDHYRRLMPTK